MIDQRSHTMGTVPGGPPTASSVSDRGTHDASMAHGGARVITGWANIALRWLYMAVKQATMILYLYCGYIQLRDALLSLFGRSRVVVLYYHRIGRPDVLTKSAVQFERDLDFYRRNYECISLFDLCGRLRAGRPIRRRAIVITFDDGYRDNITHAVPLLKSAGIPATFFVAAGFIGTGKEFPHDRRARGNSRSEPAYGFPKLTWEDLAAMERDGFEIGSHTVNHANLSVVRSAQIEMEVNESLEMLNRRLGVRPRPFSFPWGKPGDISKHALDAVVNAGYYCAASAYGGSNSRNADLLNIRRLDAGNGNLSLLALKARIAGVDPDYYRWRAKQPFQAHRTTSLQGAES
jgi:peptidoglycan/xylan/chitin deacetylase (PgdA/CDA1 family)